MSSLTSLASTIVAEAKRLADYIEQNSLPTPSFTVDGPGSLPIPHDDAQLKASQEKLHAAAQDLAILTLGPVEHLQWQAWNQLNNDISLHTIIRFKLADAIPPTGSATFDAIAATTGLSPTLVARLVRHASLQHVFHSPSPGTAAHTRASLALRTGEGVRDWLDMTFGEFGPAAMRTAHALETFAGSQEPEETGFGLAFGGRPIYRYLDEREERARVFGGAMAQLARGRTHRIEDLVEGFDWKGLGRATVVDVGGSHGHVSIAIAKAAPELRFVVQDLPSTAEQGRKMLDPALADRVSFVGHDMGDVQTVSGDVYLFRHVFPNWPQKHCVKFLQNLVPAMKPGARVLVNEGCLSACDELPRRGNQFIRNLDMCMMSCFNGNERTEDEWKEIFTLADRRFKFRGVRNPVQHSVFFIFEAVWEDSSSEEPLIPDLSEPHSPTHRVSVGGE